MDITMPQGRIVLKRICQSRKLAECKTDGARLLYTWLIPNVDINGCFSGDAEIIKGQIFTRLRKSTKVIENYLVDLVEIGLIIRYNTNGDMYLQIPDFVEKQPSLNPDKEAEPTIPPPTPDQLQTNSGLTPLKVKESKEEVKERGSKEKAKGFTPPTLDQLQSYITEKDYNVDAKKFLEWYTEAGWKTNKGRAILNWKLKVMAWSNRNGPKPKTREQEIEEQFARVDAMKESQ